MARFERLPFAVEAYRFDGTEASARAIAAAFPYRVGRPVGRSDDLLVLCAQNRLVRALEGAWVVEDPSSRVLMLLTDEEFEQTHRAEAA